mmetsp:Transcript_20694/g.61961  ORF Transcript_20694/g.61961 Transcript_20694/m.61961 type:complete len:234 (-) Transcript_20694:110-811(-)
MSPPSRRSRPKRRQMMGDACPGRRAETTQAPYVRRISSVVRSLARMGAPARTVASNKRRRRRCVPSDISSSALTKSKPRTCRRWTRPSALHETWTSSEGTKTGSWQFCLSTAKMPGKRLMPVSCTVLPVSTPFVCTVTLTTNLVPGTSSSAPPASVTERDGRSPAKSTEAPVTTIARAMPMGVLLNMPISELGSLPPLPHTYRVAPWQTRQTDEPTSVQLPPSCAAKERGMSM